jgi:hypothetical protein
MPDVVGHGEGVGDAHPAFQARDDCAFGSDELTDLALVDAPTDGGGDAGLTDAVAVVGGGQQRPGVPAPAAGEYVGPVPLVRWQVDGVEEVVPHRPPRPPDS